MNKNVQSVMSTVSPKITQYSMFTTSRHRNPLHFVREMQGFKYPEPRGAHTLGPASLRPTPYNMTSETPRPLHQSETPLKIIFIRSVSPFILVTKILVCASDNIPKRASRRLSSRVDVTETLRVTSRGRRHGDTVHDVTQQTSQRHCA